MTLQYLSLALLATFQVLLSGGPIAPLASVPLKFGENYGLYLPAHIHGSEFTCSLDSGGGDRI